MLSYEDCYDAHHQLYIHTKHHHSHRLGLSTWSHSLGLRDCGERGQSWQVLFCVLGQRAKVYICSMWTCPSARLLSESIWLFKEKQRLRLWWLGQHILSVFPWLRCGIIKAVTLKGSKFVHVNVCTQYMHTEYHWLLGIAPLPKAYMFK